MHIVGWELEGRYHDVTSYTDSALLVLSVTSVNSVNGCLAVNWQYREMQFVGAKMFRQNAHLMSQALTKLLQIHKCFSLQLRLYDRSQKKNENTLNSC